MPGVLSGTEAPGAGQTAQPEPGRPTDDPVAVLGAVDFLAEDDKIMIFDTSQARVIPALGKIR